MLFALCPELSAAYRQKGSRRSRRKRPQIIAESIDRSALICVYICDICEKQKKDKRKKIKEKTTSLLSPRLEKIKVKMS